MIEPEKRALKQLSVVLGAARSRDVFVTEILPPIARHFGKRRMVRLSAPAAAQRQQHGHAARETIASRDFATLGLRLGVLLAELQKAALDPAPEVRRFAAEMLRHRRRKLLQIAPGGEQPTALALHAVRIEVKKLRYTADFFASLYPAKKLRQYVEALAALQSVLGVVNDAAVSQQLIEAAAQAAAKPPAPVICGLAQGWIAASEARGRKNYAAAWKQFREVKSFW